MLDLLFAPERLLFTVPLLVAVSLWALALVGLLDFDALDVDVDLDVDADGGLGGGVLHALGLGVVPLSLLATFLLFAFGLVGHLLVGLFGGAVAALGVGAGTVTAVLAVPALVLGTAAAAGLARVAAPLFRDYGAAHSAAGLVGRLAVVKSNTVTTRFGAAVVEAAGDRVEVAVRSDGDGDVPMRYGDRVLVIAHDAATNTYLVAPLDEEARQALALS